MIQLEQYFPKRRQLEVKIWLFLILGFGNTVSSLVLVAENSINQSSFPLLLVLVLSDWFVSGIVFLALAFFSFRANFKIVPKVPEVALSPIPSDR